MPRFAREKYSAEELKRCVAAFDKLRKIIQSDAPDAGKFRRALDAALAAGFPIDFSKRDSWTLLHYAADTKETIGRGLPQILIDAGADVNLCRRDGHTPLGCISWDYIYSGAPEYLTAVDALLAAGAESALDEHWDRDWPDPKRQARRSWLKAYIASWPERRAAERGEDAAPDFDYAL